MAHPIRILRVVARMNVGGPALQVAALQRGLDPDRFESRLVVGSAGAEEGDLLELRAPDLAATRIPGLGRRPHPTGDVRALLTLRAEITRIRPHVVHTHTAKAGTLGRLAAWARRSAPATVHTFHGHLLHGYFGPWMARAVVLAERALAMRTDRLLAEGDAVRDDLVAAGIGRPDQYVVVPPGVPRPEGTAREPARTALGIPMSAEVVAYVGRLTAIKRPDRLASAFRRIAAARPAAILLVAGDGDRADTLRSDLDDLGERVRLLGWRSDLGRVYAASDVVVLTSDNEGMPYSLIEAAMAGVPAVTTDVGSAGEVVLDGETGRVVAPSADAVAEAAIDLLANGELRARLGSTAAPRACREYGIERLVRDTEQLYETLVGDRYRK